MSMEVLSLVSETEENILLSAVRILWSGGVVVCPTDTVYGILGNAQDENVIQKIFALKRRDKQKALGVFIKDIAAARRYAEIDDRKAKFLEHVWPGPVTVIFYKKGNLPSALTGGLPTMGLRMPGYPFLQKLLQRVSFPLVQTSANISGEAPIQSAEDARGLFGDSSLVDLVIDGDTGRGLPSTAIDFTGENPIITRAGSVSKSQLDTFWGDTVR